jgi:Leucine-rich repeat (LRR) protein
LQELTVLNLQSNNLESAAGKENWEFIDSLTNCSKLQKIGLGENNLGGVVPNSIGNFSQLQILFLGTNRLYGKFPSGISNLQSLIGLSLENNQYTGVIPEWI